LLPFTWRTKTIDHRQEKNSLITLPKPTSTSLFTFQSA
jgi:hypothetical protein